MPDLQAGLPVLLHIFDVLSTYTPLLYRYVEGIFPLWGVTHHQAFFMSMLAHSILGFEFLSHYRERYAQLKSFTAPYVMLYGTDKMVEILNRITTSMAAWKLLLLQARILKERGSVLLGDVLDIDWTTLVSFASKREGAEVGLNKKYKGKPCYQLSASFIHKVFVDARLFPGKCNPKDFFRKSVKRAISLGYYFKIVRADSAYLSLENLRFLKKLSLGYSIGAPATFNAVKQGIGRFKELSRKKSRSIIRIHKGVSALDLGEVMLSDDVSTRLLIIRRISRRKDRSTKKWRVRTYYYAIATNLELSAAKLYAFHHERQGIESGFRELKTHYHLERLPVKGLKGNEFWIICKILAMTLFKLFQLEMLPRALHSMARGTLLRVVFLNGIYLVEGKLHVARKARYKWILQRLLGKTQRLKIAVIS